MFPNKEERMRRWAVTRERGMRRFLFLNGALGWGLSTAFLWLVAMKFIDHRFILKINAPIAVIVFPLSGVVCNWFLWRISEKQFKKFMSA